MFYDVDPGKILFLDIETVPEAGSFEELSESTQKLWEQKSKFFKEYDNPKSAYEKAGIYAEFGKIICISVGFLNENDQSKRELRLKSFFGDDEKELLNEFRVLLENHFSKEDSLLCGHNSKEFDFPYIARRMLVNGIRLPKILNISGKKPWEIGLLDTLEMWKFGDYKHYTSLNLLCSIFKIPTPKDDISGSDVGRVYWEEKNLKRIAEYCEKDVAATVQLFLRYRGEELIKEDSIQSRTEFI